jgi:hypothetical protein
MNKVDVIAEFLAEENFRLAVLRRNSKKVDQLKTGFYYIALKANVPIIPAFNFGKKEVNLSPPPQEISMKINYLKKHFKGVEGKIVKRI